MSFQYAATGKCREKTVAYLDKTPYNKIMEQQLNQKIFYHGSEEHLPKGTVLVPQPDYELRWGINEWYKVLEHYRPADKLSHKDAVFMCDNDMDLDNAGGGTDWVFKVRPLGPVSCHDLNWGSEISMLLEQDPDNIEAIENAAHNYWAGVPHSNESVWDYLTPSAKIISVEEF
jgi:hypothetical protein